MVLVKVYGQHGPIYWDTLETNLKKGISELKEVSSGRRMRSNGVRGLNP